MTEPPAPDDAPRSDDPKDEELDLSGFADLVARDLASMGLSETPAARSESLLDDWDDTDWDDTDPDPGCTHPWFRLDFVSDEPGLGCSRCGRAWLLEDVEDSQDALLVVWQAARHEFERVNRSMRAVASVVEGLSGLRRCLTCGEWGDASSLAEFDGAACCPQHIGTMLAESHDPAALFTAAAGWLVDRQYIASPDLTSQWVVETNVLEFPPLGEAFGRPDEALGSIIVRLHPDVAARAGVPTRTTIGQAAAALAMKLGLDAPTSRPSQAFMLGLLAQADHSARVGKPLDTVEALTHATPVNATHRAVIVMDMCRSDMPDGTSFTGDMADDLVRSVGSRALEILT